MSSPGALRRSSRSRFGHACPVISLRSGFKLAQSSRKDDLLYVIDPRPYQADFDRAAAEVERMQAQQKLAQIELDRAKELRAKNTISASEFDQKAATYQGASAATASAVAAKNAAALNLEFTQVKSPIDGRVSDERITAR